MAGKPRKAWSQLTAGTRQRKLRFYGKQGLTPRQVAARYNSGSLGSQAAARGHAVTPEHGLKQALQNPRKYQDYLRKQEKPKPKEEPSDTAIRINTILDRAFANFDGRLSHYVYYNVETVRANVYGGSTRETGDVPGMSYAQALWTARADTEDIRSMASDQYRGNPWFYH